MPSPVGSPALALRQFFPEPLRNAKRPSASRLSLCFLTHPGPISRQFFQRVSAMEKKGRREARVGSLNIAGAKTGVMDKDQIPFSYEQVSPYVFKITPDQPLEPGEYGFLFALVGGAGPGLSGGVAGARVFDFTVK